MKPSKIKIDVTKIIKEHLYKGEKGTYLSCSVWPNKDGVDRFGSTHVIKQEISREAREAGEREPIIGNMTLVEAEEYHHGTDKVTRPPSRQHPTKEYEQRRGAQQRTDAERLRNPQSAGRDEADDGGEVPF